MKNSHMKIGVSLIMVGLLSFVSGVKYSEMKSTGAKTNSVGSITRSRGQQNGENRFGNNGMNGRSIGEVLGKDDHSITLKLPDGSSKIIILSEKTNFQKSIHTDNSEVAVGNQILVNGSTNPDGSITAESIQLNPNTLFRDRQISPTSKKIGGY